MKPYSELWFITIVKFKAEKGNNGVLNRKVKEKVQQYLKTQGEGANAKKLLTYLETLHSDILPPEGTKWNDYQFGGSVFELDSQIQIKHRLKHSQHKTHNKLTGKRYKFPSNKYNPTSGKRIRTNNGQTVYHKQCNQHYNCAHWIANGSCKFKHSKQ